MFINVCQLNLSQCVLTVCCVCELLLVTGTDQHCYLCVLPGKIKGGERGGGGAREGGGGNRSVCLFKCHTTLNEFVCGYV